MAQREQHAEPRDDYANRRGRRRATQQIRKWVGDLDEELLNRWEEEEEADAPSTFERFRSRRPLTYDE